jgi:hypothetical protein
MNTNTIDIKTKLSTLWILVMINMIFADILTITVELVYKNTMAIPGDVKVIMAIAAFVTNIPILMIYFSRVLPYKWNRLSNIIAGIFTIIYIVGPGDTSLHYVIIATIEVIILVIIVVNSWKWRESEDNIH